MNLVKATGTIGGLTLVSRIAGFAREMLMSRIMGASAAADASPSPEDAAATAARRPSIPSSMPEP